MLKDTSKDFREFFLLQFTKELIKQFYLKNKEKIDSSVILERPSKKQIKEKLIPKKRILNDSEFMEELTKPLLRRISIDPMLTNKKLVLTVPEPKLPPVLKLKKRTLKDEQIDLERLNPLIKDPLVKVIECDGAGKQLIVKGKMGTKKTNIILKKEEIDDIIERFSKESKTPINDGMFKVTLGKLVISAVISKVVGTKFIIEKLQMYAPKY